MKHTIKIILKISSLILVLIIIAPAIIVNKWQVDVNSGKLRHQELFLVIVLHEEIKDTVVSKNCNVIENNKAEWKDVSVKIKYGLLYKTKITPRYQLANPTLDYIDMYFRNKHYKKEEKEKICNEVLRLWQCKGNGESAFEYAAKLLENQT